MPRLRRSRRRARAEEPVESQDAPGTLPDEENGDYTFEPFVPVAGGYEQESIAEPDAEPDTALAPPPPRRRSGRLPVSRPRLPRPSLGPGVQWTRLLLALVLVAGGAFGTLLYQDRLQRDVEEWWPLGVIAIAGLWMLIALVQRQPAAFLGGSVVAGVGISMLLETQDIARLDETGMGVILVTIGLGIVIRGLLLRQEYPA